VEGGSGACFSIPCKGEGGKGCRTAILAAFVAGDTGQMVFRLAAADQVAGEMDWYFYCCSGLLRLKTA
jgi:hypothetical protein